MSIIVQQDATIYIFIIFLQNSSICFRWYPHPSSGAHSNCNYNIWHWSNRTGYRPLTWRSRNVVPTPPVPDVTVWVCSWRWMRVSSETCRAVLQKYNKTVYSRILFENYWRWFTMHGPMCINPHWNKMILIIYNPIGQYCNTDVMPFAI